MIKGLTALLLFLIVNSSATALSPLVRVDLSGCQLQGSSIFSGVLLQLQGNTYVVTSSWAQLTSKERRPLCEKIYTERAVLKTLPLVTDHLAGLSIYQVFDFHETLEAPVTPPDSAAIWTWNGLQIKKYDGDIAINGSRRHQLPLWDRVLEWLGAPVPVTSLGSGVWGDHGNLLGIVTHEYLQLSPGHKTILSQWSLKGQDSHDHLIIISSQDVLAWLTRQIAQPVEPVVWKLNDHRSGIDRWTMGDLEFTSLCPSPTEINPGGEYPIGGNDGFGIGGDSVQNKACRVSTSRSAEVQTSWLPDSLQIWERSAQEDLLQKRNISFWYGLTRTDGRLNRDYFYSVESLIKNSLDPSKKWVDWVERPTPPAEPNQLRANAQILRSKTLQCYSQLYIHEPNVQELVRQLYFYSVLTQSRSWKELQPKELTDSLAPQGIYAQGWKTLAWEGACMTPDLRKTTEVFASEFQKVWQP